MVASSAHPHGAFDRDDLDRAVKILREADVVVKAAIPRRADQPEGYLHWVLGMFMSLRADFLACIQLSEILLTSPAAVVCRSLLFESVRLEYIRQNSDRLDELILRIHWRSTIQEKGWLERFARNWKVPSEQLLEELAKEQDEVKQRAKDEAMSLDALPGEKKMADNMDLHLDEAMAYLDGFVHGNRMSILSRLAETKHGELGYFTQGSIVDVVYIGSYALNAYDLGAKAAAQLLGWGRRRRRKFAAELQELSGEWDRLAAQVVTRAFEGDLPDPAGKS